MRGLLIIVLMLSGTLWSQSVNYNDSTITIYGKVRDTARAVGFYNMVIVNKSTSKGVFGDYAGNFSITIKKSDTLGIAVRGYKTIYLSYRDSVYRPSYSPVFYVQELAYVGEEVIVVPLKTLEELKAERAAIEKREVPSVTVTNAIQSPITALYVAFSKREKTKRLVAEMEYQDSQDAVVREILRIYVHHDIIYLSQDDFDEFIHYLNLNPEFLKAATDYELVTYIKSRFEQFQLIKQSGY
jgi:hypothetical protein